jgi:Phospholipase_D-nuclease N-terminal
MSAAAIVFLAVFGVLLGLAAIVFWVLMLIDCLQNPRLTGTERLVWVLVLIFLHLLGALLYLVIGRARPVV